jgi:hypothetical protein
MISSDSEDLSEADLPDRDAFAVVSHSTVISLLETNLYRKVWPAWKSTVKSSPGSPNNSSSPAVGLHPARTHRTKAVRINSVAFNFVPFN